MTILVQRRISILKEIKCSDRWMLALYLVHCVEYVLDLVGVWIYYLFVDDDVSPGFVTLIGMVGQFFYL